MKLLSSLLGYVVFSAWICKDSFGLNAFPLPLSRGYLKIASSSKLSSVLENTETQNLVLDAAPMGPSRRDVMIKSPNTNRYRYSNAMMIDKQQQIQLQSQSQPLLRKEEDSDWWKKLTKLSNVASILCVLDCTVLPLVSIALPLLGGGLSILNQSTSACATGTCCESGLMESIGHSVALYFVIPLGLFTAILHQFTATKSLRASSSSFLSTVIPKLPFLGLSLIYLANAPMSHLQFLPPSLVQSLHCGTTLHRIVNLSGCMIMLGSNYYINQNQQCAFQNTSNDSNSSVCWLGCCVPENGDNSGQQQEATFFTWEK